MGKHKFLYQRVTQVTLYGEVEVDERELEAYIERWKQNNPNAYEYSMKANKERLSRKEATRDFIEERFQATHEMPPWIDAPRSWTRGVTIEPNLTYIKWDDRKVGED